MYKYDTVDYILPRFILVVCIHILRIIIISIKPNQSENIKYVIQTTSIL